MQAQGEALIQKALTELKLWGFQRTFAFVAGSEAASGGAATGKQAPGGRVPLIKEWSEVLSELADHQSLVASLKTSQYYHQFKVCLLLGGTTLPLGSLLYQIPRQLWHAWSAGSLLRR